MSNKSNQQAAKRKSSGWLVPAIVAVFVAGVFYWAMNQGRCADAAVVGVRSGGSGCFHDA